MKWQRWKPTKWNEMKVMMVWVRIACTNVYKDYTNAQEIHGNGGKRSMYRYLHKRKSALCFRVVDFQQCYCGGRWRDGRERDHAFIFMNIISAWKCYSIAGWRYFCIRFNILPNFSESRFQCARFHCVSWRLAFRDLYLSFSLSIYIVLTEQS